MTWPVAGFLLLPNAGKNTACFSTVISNAPIGPINSRNGRPHRLKKDTKLKRDERKETQRSIPITRKLFSIWHLARHFRKISYWSPRLWAPSEEIHDVTLLLTGKRRRLLFKRMGS